MSCVLVDQTHSRQSTHYKISVSTRVPLNKVTKIAGSIKLDWMNDLNKPRNKTKVII